MGNCRQDGTATAAVEEKTPASVTAAARAVREGHDLAATRLRVELPAGDLPELAEKIEAEWVRLMPLTHEAFQANGRVAP